MNLPQQPKVSVIIPTYKDWDRLKLCLDALQKQTYSDKLIEIIVINNDDSISDSPLVHDFPSVVFLNEYRKGSYAARNRGLQYSSGEVIAFTDSDCIPDIDWLTNAVDYLKKNKSKRIGGNIELFFRSSSRNFAEMYESCYAFRQKEFVEKQGMAATANMITCKTLFDKVGLFNDSLLSGGDAEWGIRASNKGYAISYLDDVVVKHPSRESLKEIFIKNRREAAGKIKNRPLGSLLLGLLKGMLPPVKSVFYIRMKNIPISHIFASFLIRYILRIDTAIEQIKVGVLHKDAERN